MLINQAVGATGSTSADCLVLMIPENPRRREKVALDILELLLDLAAERKKQARDRNLFWAYHNNITVDLYA